MSADLGRGARRADAPLSTFGSTDELAAGNEPSPGGFMGDESAACGEALSSDASVPYDGMFASCGLKGLRRTLVWSVVYTRSRASSWSLSTLGSVKRGGVSSRCMGDGATPAAAGAAGECGSAAAAPPRCCWDGLGGGGITRLGERAPGGGIAAAPAAGGPALCAMALAHGTAPSPRCKWRLRRTGARAAPGGVAPRFGWSLRATRRVLVAMAPRSARG